MSKQAFVPQVSPAELTRIKAEQKREILWWKNYPIMRSQNDMIVSSMARTTTLQGKLVLNGNPAVGDENSTHCRLGAFDFGIEGFIKYGRTDALGILDEILQDMHDRDLINWIKEPEINVYHVAINPNFKE